MIQIVKEKGCKIYCGRTREAVIKDLVALSEKEIPRMVIDITTLLGTSQEKKDGSLIFKTFIYKDNNFQIKYEQTSQEKIPILSGEGFTIIDKPTGEYEPWVHSYFVNYRGKNVASQVMSSVYSSNTGVGTYKHGTWETELKELHKEALAKRKQV